LSDAARLPSRARRLWARKGSIEGLEDLLWECTARRGHIVPEFDRKGLDSECPLSTARVLSSPRPASGPSSPRTLEGPP
jgi:hypothetical protein